MAECEASVPLASVLRGILLHPWDLLRQWNWKAAAFSAIVRGAMFFLINRHAGGYLAAKAMAVELLYASVAAGVAGAATQRLRNAAPRVATGVVVYIALPLAMLAVEAVVHRAMGTPRLRSSLLASFLFASLATGFNWYLMSRGVFVTGSTRTFRQDLAQLPGLLIDFLRSAAFLSTRAKRAASTNRGMP